jgi:peptidoglycan lytic transglycosylase
VNHSQSIRAFLVVIGSLFPLLLQGCSGLLSQKQLPPPPPPVVSAPAAPVVQEEPAKPEGSKVQVGKASWYGPYHDGKETASGEIFDPHKLTAAHPTLPLGSTATVTNLETGKSVKVKITDRGPYVKGRKIDLSQAAASKIGMTKAGVAKVKIVSTSPQRKRKNTARKPTRNSPTQIAKETARQSSASAKTVPQSPTQAETDSNY